MAVIDLLIQNWEGGSNARYDVSRMHNNGDGTYSYEGYNFDSEGRPLSGGVPGDGPGQWVPGKPGARGGSGPGGGGGGGSFVDPSSSAYYQQVKSILDAQANAERSATKAAIQKALISFGLVPEGFQDKLNALDDLTRSLIQKNTDSGISTYARLLEDRQDSINDLVNRLTSRGLRRSGARGNRLRRGQLDFDRVFQDALSQLLGTTEGYYTTLANNDFQRQLQLAQALSQTFNFSPGGGGGGGGAFNPAFVNNTQAVGPEARSYFAPTPRTTYSDPFAAMRGGAGGGAKGNLFAV